MVVDPRATASFSALTADRMLVLIHVGVETQIGQRRPGHFFIDDPELDPLADINGRRFNVMYLEKLEH